MPYEIRFQNPEEKAAFDAWYANIESVYPDTATRDAVVKQELEKRGLSARSKYVAVSPMQPPRATPVNGGRKL